MTGKRKRASIDDPSPTPSKSTPSSQTSTSDNNLAALPASKIAECPFTITLCNPTKSKSRTSRTRPFGTTPRKRKSRASTAGSATPAPSSQTLDTTPFSDDPSLYQISPASGWLSMKRYAKAVIREETFSVGDYVFVNHSPDLAGAGAIDTDDDSDAAEITPATWRNYWVGQLLEVKAKDATHVWVRVFWMYWPEEIPEDALGRERGGWGGMADRVTGGSGGNFKEGKGRGNKGFYGFGELVASNHMDIIDATTIAGRAEVEHWVEGDEDKEVVFEDKLYWRQKFDYPTRTLSELKHNCACNGYANPDKLLILCESCKRWLHDDCIIGDIKLNFVLTTEPGALPIPANPPKKSPAANTNKKLKSAERVRSSLLQTAISTAAGALTPNKKGKANQQQVEPEGSDSEITVEVRGATTPIKTEEKIEDDKKIEGDTLKRMLSKKQLSSELELVDVELLMAKEGEVTKARVKDARGDGGVVERVVEIRCLCCREVLG